MMSVTKNPHPQAKIFFRVQSTRLADPFEPLNSSLAQSAEELGRWYSNRKLLFFCENRQNHSDAKVLTIHALFTNACSFFTKNASIKCRK